MEDGSPKSRKKFLFIGLGLQIFALLFGYYCFYSILFIGWMIAFFVCIPVFIIGIILIFFSRIRLVYKFILGFWILVFPLVWIGQDFYEKHSVQNEVYLIPQNYRGAVKVYFGDANAENPTIENKAVVIKINPTGEAKTVYSYKHLSYHLNISREDFREYYYVDNSGNKTKLHLNRNPENDELIVTPEVEYFSDDKETIASREFFIGTQSEFRDYLEKKSQPIFP